MNSKNISKDTNQSPPEGRHSMQRLGDDIESPSFPMKPQYAILVEAGWPGNYQVVAPKPLAVGLKPRRQAEASQQTFSVQGADEDIIARVKQFVKTRSVTIKSVVELFFLEGLEKHGG